MAQDRATACSRGSAIAHGYRPYRTAAAVAARPLCRSSGAGQVRGGDQADDRDRARQPGDGDDRRQQRDSQAQVRRQSKQFDRVRQPRPCWPASSHPQPAGTRPVAPVAAGLRRTGCAARCGTGCCAQAGRQPSLREALRPGPAAWPSAHPVRQASGRPTARIPPRRSGSVGGAAPPGCPGSSWSSGSRHGRSVDVPGGIATWSAPSAARADRAPWRYAGRASRRAESSIVTPASAFG
jgi:hypothetical protein